MPFAMLLILVGLLGPAAGAMWRRGQWLQSAQWIRGNVSPPAVVATPLLGLVVASAGLMLIWPPAVLLTFIAAAGLVLVLVSAARGGTVWRLLPALDSGWADEESREPRDGRRSADRGRQGRPF
jgi:hypothetical protein